jgi:hypothetical protein
MVEPSDVRDVLYSLFAPPYAVSDAAKESSNLVLPERPPVDGMDLETASSFSAV